MDNDKKYGPFDVVWMGPCVWAGILDELPPELVGRKVYITIAPDAERVEPTKVTGVYVEPTGTISFTMNNGEHHIIPAVREMPDGLDHATFVSVAMANAILHAHERLDELGVQAHPHYEPTVKVLPFLNRGRKHYPSNPPREGFFSRIRTCIANLFD